MKNNALGKRGIAPKSKISTSGTTVRLGTLKPAKRGGSGGKG